MDASEDTALSDQTYCWLLHLAAEVIRHAEIREFIRCKYGRESEDGKKKHSWESA